MKFNINNVHVYDRIWNVITRRPDLHNLQVRSKKAQKVANS